MHYAILPLLAALIPAAVSAIGGIVSSLSGASATRKANEQQFQQNLYMAGQERGWALEDVKAQNEYNSPANQMARLKAAGLNPMLAYSTGVNMPAATVRSTDVKPAEVKPVNPAGGVSQSVASGIGTYMDIRSQQMAQDANDRAQAMLFANLSNKNADTLYKIAQTGKLGVDTGISEVKLLNQQKLIDSQLSVAAANAQKSGVQTASIYDANSRANAMFSVNFEEALTRIALNRDRSKLIENQNLTETQRRTLMSASTDQIRAAIANMAKEGTIKDYEINLNKHGSTKGDNIFMRTLHAGLATLADKLKELFHIK